MNAVLSRAKYLPADSILDRLESMTTTTIRENAKEFWNQFVRQQTLNESENNAIDNVIKLLKSEYSDFHTAWAAVKAIEISGFKTANVIEALIWALGWEDEFDCIIQAAGRVLLAIGDASVPALIAALDHSNSRVRLSAIEVLADFGPKAMDAVPALIKMSRTGSPEQQNTAIRAMIKILYPEGFQKRHETILQ